MRESGHEQPDVFCLLSAQRTVREALAALLAHTAVAALHVDVVALLGEAKYTSGLALLLVQSIAAGF